MNLKKIFLKQACPTSIGGQAIMEGVMMQGPYRTAAAVRLPDQRIYMKTWNLNQRKAWRKIPFIRGIISFFGSLVFGMKIMTFSADVAEYFADDEETEGGTSEAAEQEEAGPVYSWLLHHLGEQGLWNLMMAVSLIAAFVFAILVFAVLATAAVSLLKPVVHSAVGLNLIEGLLRIAMFVLYIAVISRMKD
ncbi:MAG: DUF1385 domain-containing protein, partial [Eubacterium sp.]|nr:DUF1385 domain-containing protein [Eubacterium sp.]